MKWMNPGGVLVTRGPPRMTYWDTLDWRIALKICARDEARSSREATMREGAISTAVLSRAIYEYLPLLYILCVSKMWVFMMLVFYSFRLRDDVVENCCLGIMCVWCWWNFNGSIVKCKMMHGCKFKWFDFKHDEIDYRISYMFWSCQIIKY